MQPEPSPARPEPVDDINESRSLQDSHVLKYGDTFMVSNAQGDLLGRGDGLFRDGTRVLSRFQLTLGGRRPTLLAASVTRDGVVFTADLSNPPLGDRPGLPSREGVLHLQRARLIWGTTLYERLSVTNHGAAGVSLPLAYSFGADFHDLFEVRGRHRQQRGTNGHPQVTADRVALSYLGRDNVLRRTHLAFSLTPDWIEAGRAEFTAVLAPRESWELLIEIGAEAPPAPTRARFRTALAQALRRARSEARRGAGVRSSDRLFDAWLSRARADLALLITEKPTGPYPYAGIPWFSTPFGRDGIITALQTLWLDPGLARGVLGYLAQTQAQEVSAFRDSQPGKILHETRQGEMPALGEVPFARYYGAVDTTPLFVILAAAYAERTGDMAGIETIWPALLAAMQWIDRYGDSNADGFVDYAPGEASGLANQGWKDSADSISHQDGSLAAQPIALVEVQGQVYGALRGMADLAARRGDDTKAASFRAQAEALRNRVEARFWLEDLGTYAIALDGEGRPCRVASSNAGQLLASGLPSPERAARVAASLRSPGLDCGWGVRTLSSKERRFNPISYHNGSVWPHDTALCAVGLRNYGHSADAARLLDGLFAVAAQFDMQLPELFCGFERRPGEPPVPYPVACKPQAWAAGSVFMLLQACLGLRIDGARTTIHLDDPALPNGVDDLTISRLAVGEHRVDLRIRRAGGQIEATLTGAPGVVLMRR